MSSLNSQTIIGNVGSEPEMRFVPSGKATTSFSVACNEKYGDKESTEWFSIVTWNKLAEVCNQYLSKGQQVYVEGRTQTRSWETDGVKHYKQEVIANKVIFLGQRKQENTEEIGEDVPF
jgi:single-strand DNA-binding protein